MSLIAPALKSRHVPPTQQAPVPDPGSGVQDQEGECTSSPFQTAGLDYQNNFPDRQQVMNPEEGTVGSSVLSWLQVLTLTRLDISSRRMRLQRSGQTNLKPVAMATFSPRMRDRPGRRHCCPNWLRRPVSPRAGCRGRPENSLP